MGGVRNGKKERNRIRGAGLLKKNLVILFFSFRVEGRMEISRILVVAITKGLNTGVLSFSLCIFFAWGQGP